MLWLIDTMPGNIHHAVRERGAEEDAQGGNDEDDFETGRLRSDRRIEEVDGIVTHTYRQIDDCQQEQENDQ